MITTKGAVYLDGSNPAVGPYLAGRFAQMVEDYKPVFMKWDHHYGSLEEGKRYDPTMTGLQAHNKAIRTIRAALPEDLIITRSMGWIYGAIECYDAIRIGNDINHPGMGHGKHPDNTTNMTYGMTSGKIEVLHTEKEYKGLIRFARQVAQNYYIHNNIAICDPDAFFVTDQFSEDEAKCHLTLQSIMGGLLFIGDRIDLLSDERLAIANHTDILSLNKEGIHAVPLDLFQGPDIPRIWKLELANRTIVAVFNWLDESVASSYEISDFEMTEDNYQVRELWTGHEIDFKESLNLKEEPHSVKVFEFTK
ncbi:MAG: hypothetical protein HQL32_16555 [Planctomycetes bacterium]|nr:hypothetical protein [Planctomycetota bacterium]